MPTKRSDRVSKAPAAKKIKVDPITEKINIVVEALKDAECEIPEPVEDTRSALVPAVPHALGAGAASNERHGYQSSVAGIIGEILAATEGKWQRKLAEATKQCDDFKADHASRDDALALAQGHLETQRAEEASCREAWQADTAKRKVAETALQLASGEVENFDTLQAAKADEREQFATGLSEDFEVLKASTWENPSEQKQRVSKITSLLRKLPSTGASLLSALPPALAKKSCDRGVFDETVISNVEGTLKEHLASLEDDLGNGEALKSQKQCLAKEAEATLDRTKQEVETSQNKLAAAVERMKELEAEELKLVKSAREQAEAVSDLEIHAFHFKVFLQNSREVLTAFAFLRDRVETPMEDTEGKDANQMAAEEVEPAATAITA